VQLPLAGLLPSASSTRQQEHQQQPPQRQQAEGLPGLAVEQADGALCVECRQLGGASCRLTFDQATGGLTCWQVDVGADGGAGRELLAAPVAPCFYRAATDNDRGGSGGSSYTAR